MDDERRAIRPKDELFPKFALDYFEQLRQQYDLLLDETGGKQPASVAAVIATVDHDRTHATWAEVFMIEAAYLYALPDDRLAPEVLRFRNRFGEVAGSAAYAAYLTSVSADVSKSGAVELRAELLTLAERIRYLYTFVPPRELIRNKLAVNAAVLTVVVAALFTATCVAAYATCHFVPTMLIVAFAGMLGGFLSVQQRLQTSDDVDPLFKELQLKAGWFGVVVLAPFSGAVFAIVLYWLFLAALLSGGLFPTFADASGLARAGFDAGVFFWRGVPAQPADFGKLMAWAFVAGFAERFVPDVLTRLTNQVSAPAKKSATVLTHVPQPQAQGV